jgi:hypothetical protein
MSGTKRRLSCSVAQYDGHGRYGCIKCGLRFEFDDELRAHLSTAHKQPSILRKVSTLRNTQSGAKITPMSHVQPAEPCDAGDLADGEAYNPIDFANPWIDMVYVLYLKSISTFIESPEKMMKCAMNKRDFFVSGAWESVNISFLGLETRAKIITAVAAFVRDATK